MELVPGKNEARIVIVEGREVVEIKLTQDQVGYVDLEVGEQVRHHRWYAMRARKKYYAVRQAFMHRQIVVDHLAETIDHED